MTSEWMKVEAVEDVVDVLRTARDMADTPLSAISAQTRLSKGYISQIENRGRGAVEPSLTTCLKLLNVYGFELHIVRKVMP